MQDIVTAVFIWGIATAAHRRAPQGIDDVSVFCGALRWLTVFIHLKTAVGKAKTLPQGVPMNNAIKRALPRILPLIIWVTLFLPVTAWAQKTAEPELRINERHGCSVQSVAFSPDGKTLASTHNDSTIGLWDVRTGRFIRSFVGHTGHVPTIVFSPDGKTLAGGSPDQTVKLWEVSSGRFIRAFTGHRDSVYSVAFSPD